MDAEDDVEDGEAMASSTLVVAKEYLVNHDCS